MKNTIKFLLPSIFIIFFLLISSKKSDISKVIITREECNGAMNSIDCNILLEKKTDNKYISFNDYTISKFEILDETFEYNRSDIVLAGGECIVLVLNPGKYRIQCLTPIDKQNNYLKTNEVWTSEYLYFELTPNSTESFVIKPQVDDNGYSGAWNLEKDK
ncbi:MAG: hypothetical protein IK024_03220 [Treponema sp.]|nr:hypothetical protein [Treponema sp.]